MNISGMVNSLKQKMRERETNKAEKVAQSLKKLKEDRVRLEGQNRIYDLQAQERAKLAKAKQDLKQRRMESSVVGRVVLGVQKNIKENSKNLKKKDAPSFMKSGGGMFGEQAKSPFALQRNEPKQAVKKKSKGKVKKVVYYN